MEELMYCRHCHEQLEDGTREHDCPKAGLLNVDRGDSFLVSAVIGAVTGSAIVGGLLGGDIVGGVVGDLLDGDLMD